MKKGFLLILLGFIAPYSVSLAQTEKKKKNVWGLGITYNSVEAQIGTPLQSVLGSSFNSNADKTENSISLSIIPKLFVRDSILIRFELSITNIQFKNSLNSTSGSYHSIDIRDLNQKIYKFIPSIQWNCLKTRFIELYCGATINYFIYEKMKFNVYGELRNLPNDTLLSWSTSQTIYKGGFSLGIGAFGGLNILINRHISVGSEFSSSLLYNRIGGNYHSERTYQNLPNPQVTEVSGISSNLYRGLQFSKILSSLNISFWF